MAKAPKPTPKPAAKASKASAKPLPKKAPPPPKAKKARGLDPVAADEAADAGVQAAMAEVDDNELPQKPSKKGKPLTEAFAVQEPARAPVPARLVPLSILRPSPTNPRKNLGDLTELAASLASIGQLQPLVARPHPQETGALEVVCGHRRFAAAALAKLGELLVVERVLSDREVLEAQLTENGQRSDVHPLEEAAALHQLHRHHRVEVAELAARLGRGEGYVRHRLRLMHLTSEVAAAFEANRLTLAVAMRLARLPEKAQKAALGHVAVDEGETPKTLSQAEWMLDRLHLRLVDSPFALDDESLPGGSCLACPKRTGNQLVIFEADEGDLCTDPECHKAKVNESKARQIKAAEARGIEVLPADKAPFDWGGHVRHDAEFIDLDAPVPEPEVDESDDQAEGDDDEQGDESDLEPEPPRRTWRDVLGDKVKVVLAEDRNGKLHELVCHDEVRDALPPNAPEELHEAVALREKKEKRESDWKKQHAEAQARREAHEARAKALAATLPVLDPRAFRTVAVGIMANNAWPFEDGLKALGAWKEDERGDHDKEATDAAVRELPLEALWRLWLADALSDTDINLDELEAPEAPAPAMRPVTPAPASDPELLPPSDPRSAVARTVAAPLEEPVPEVASGASLEARREVIRATILRGFEQGDETSTFAPYALRAYVIGHAGLAPRPTDAEVTEETEALLQAGAIVVAHRQGSEPRYGLPRKGKVSVPPPAAAPRVNWNDARKRFVGAVVSEHGKTATGGRFTAQSLAARFDHAIPNAVDVTEHFLGFFESADALACVDEAARVYELSCNVDLARISECIWKMGLDYVVGLVDDQHEPPTTGELADAVQMPQGLITDIVHELLKAKRLKGQERSADGAVLLTVAPQKAKKAKAGAS